MKSDAYGRFPRHDIEGFPTLCRVFTEWLGREYLDGKHGVPWTGLLSPSVKWTFLCHSQYTCQLQRRTRLLQ